MGAHLIAPVERTTLRQAVVARIRDAIDGGTLAPGSHLREIEMSGSLSVSRATLREAFRELVDEGVLVQDARGRVSVRRVRAGEIAELFEVRFGLERIAVRRLCARESRQRETALLREALGHLDGTASFAEGLRADLRFHELLCELSGNEPLLRSWRSLSGLIRVTMLSSGVEPARLNMTADRHAPIVDLIELGDGVACEEFLEAHMASALSQLTGMTTTIG